MAAAAGRNSALPFPLSAGGNSTIERVGPAKAQLWVVTAGAPAYSVTPTQSVKWRDAKRAGQDTRQRNAG